MNYLISDTLGNKIIKYLEERPYKEVESLIKELNGLPPVNVVSSNPSGREVNNHVQSEESKASEENVSQEAK